MKSSVDNTKKTSVISNILTNKEKKSNEKVLKKTKKKKKNGKKDDSHDISLSNSEKIETKSQEKLNVDDCSDLHMNEMIQNVEKIERIDSMEMKENNNTNIDQDIESFVEDKTKYTIYVEGISYKANEGDLVSHFSKCGVVKDVRLPRYQDSNRPLGYAHISFEEKKAFDEAIKMDKEYLMGRYLSIKKAETPRSVRTSQEKSTKVKKGCRTIFIKQLPYDTNENEIKDALSSCGEIMNIRLAMWNHTKKLKGFGYVEFSTEEGAKNATKKSGIKIGNRMVLIDYDTGAPKASFRKLNGQFWAKAEEGKASLAKKMADKVGKNKRAIAPKNLTTNFKRTRLE